MIEGVPFLPFAAIATNESSRTVYTKVLFIFFLLIHNTLKAYSCGGVETILSSSHCTTPTCIPQAFIEPLMALSDSEWLGYGD
jgi:hypothetical protein